MNLGISGISAYRTINYTVKNNNKHIQPSFQGVKNTKALQNAGLALASMSLLTIFSCGNNNQKQNFDAEKIDSSKVITKNENSFDNKNKVRTYYYYFPKKDNIINPDKYDWSETVYPDGRIEKDSMGYKIIITPEGERIIAKTPYKENNDTTDKKEAPDSLMNDTISVQNDSTDIFEQVDDYIIPDDNEFEYEHEAPINENPINKHYNDNNILLYWDSNDSEINENDSTNVYDSLGRLIYDDANNEHFEYKGKRKNPYKSTARLENCIRYTLYNKNGSIKSIYFKASDGTITNLDDIKKSK